MAPLISLSLHQTQLDIRAGLRLGYAGAVSPTVLRVNGFRFYFFLSRMVQAINGEEATGVLATRYAPERYQEFRLE